MIELCRMSLYQLQNVENFKIWNEHGSVEFIDNVDLTDVDLADVVTIVAKYAEVYNDDEQHKNTKPKVGQKLNNPAIIKLNNIKPRKNQTSSAKEEILKTGIEKSGEAEHLSYDGDHFVWEFKVPHFTKWGDEEYDEEEDDDEDMDQDNQEQEEKKQIEAE